jgi:hypothetical protein
MQHKARKACLVAIAPRKSQLEIAKVKAAITSRQRDAAPVRETAMPGESASSRRVYVVPAEESLEARAAHLVAWGYKLTSVELIPSGQPRMSAFGQAGK